MIFSHVLYQLSYLARQKNPPEPLGARAGSSPEQPDPTGSPLPPARAGSTYRRPSKIDDETIQLEGKAHRQLKSQRHRPPDPLRGKRRPAAALQNK